MRVFASGVLCKGLRNLERETGFEPATLALAIQKIETLEGLDEAMVSPQTIDYGIGFKIRMVR